MSKDVTPRTTYVSDKSVAGESLIYRPSLNKEAGEPLVNRIALP